MDTNNEALKQTFVKAAIPTNFQFNEAYAEDDRLLLASHYVESEIDKLGGKLVVENGQPRVVQKNHPELDLYDEGQTRVTLETLVPKAITGLGTQQAQAKAAAGFYHYEPSAEDLKPNQYIQNGVTHSKVGNMVYPSAFDTYMKSVEASVNSRLTPQQRAKARLEQQRKR